MKDRKPTKKRAIKSKCPHANVGHPPQKLRDGDFLRAWCMDCGAEGWVPITIDWSAAPKRTPPHVMARRLPEPPKPAARKKSPKRRS